MLWNSNGSHYKKAIITRRDIVRRRVEVQGEEYSNSNSKRIMERERCSGGVDKKYHNGDKYE